MNRHTLKISALLVVVFLSSCQSIDSNRSSDLDMRELTVLYTNDEHGWMEGMAPGQGAANLYELWREQEGFREDGPFLLLSGGDNWTGPAISTWVEGQSMVEVMNAMGYDASAVGNHEFDFGLDVLAERFAEADFPYLSANTAWRDTGKVPVEIGILPYVIREVNGLKVGIVGLTTVTTPRAANPQHVVRLQFNDYEQALRATIPEVRQADPDLLFVIAHVCLLALEPLAVQVADLDIDLMGGGHCNELGAKRVGETVLLGGGYHFTAYARAHFQYDRRNEMLVDMDYGTRSSAGADQDPGIAAIVGRWQGQFEEVLGEVVAWSDRVIDFRSAEFRQAVTDSWLLADPDADIAITNLGGLRTPLPAGEVTLSDLVNMMPFENNIVAVTVPGRVVIDAVERGGRPVVAGLTRQDDQWLLTRTGTPIQTDARYRVLVNSFMYAGGDNYEMFREADPDGYDTGIHYRQPFVDRLSNLATSPDNPLRIEDLVGSWSKK